MIMCNIFNSYHTIIAIIIIAIVVFIFALDPTTSTTALLPLDHCPAFWS